MTTACAPVDGTALFAPPSLIDALPRPVVIDAAAVLAAFASAGAAPGPTGPQPPAGPAEAHVADLEVVHRLARAAESCGGEAGRHVVRVGRYAAIVAGRLGLDAATRELIELAAPLHDVGKIGVPAEILLKPGRLTADEYEVVKRHAEAGERILRAAAGPDSPLLATAARIAGTHHERWDGAGYPRGLAGEAIPLEGRIVAVADVFDALSSERPHKPAFPLWQCLAILGEGRDRHFDPRVLDAFFDGLDDVLVARRELAD